MRSNGHLAKIDSESEDQYIKQTFISSASDFWIGLTDQVAEGVFRYARVKISTLKSCIVCKCAGGWKVIPYWYQITRIQTGLVAVQLLRIRVLMIASSLQVMDGKFMTTFVTQAPSLFYADKKVMVVIFENIHCILVCSSSDGVSCATSAPEVSSPLSATIIAVIIVIAVMLIVVILVIILLVLMWKYKNDAFYRYILCCVYGGSKTQINNLKQENIRLRKELSQQKLNLSSSDRFQPGQLCKWWNILTKDYYTILLLYSSSDLSIKQSRSCCTIGCRKVKSSSNPFFFF